MSTENSKINEPHNFVLSLPQILDIKTSGKYSPLQNLPIYYTWKDKRQQNKNSRLKIIAPTWNYEFELPDSSYFLSDIQDNIKYIIKKYETLADYPPIHIYIIRIYNGLVFEIKDRYMLELQTAEFIKLFGSIKKLIDKTRNGENIPSLEMVEVF